VNGYIPPHAEAFWTGIFLIVAGVTFAIFIEFLRPAAVLTIVVGLILIAWSIRLRNR